MKTIADIGIIGLAVMGENLALNMESKGFTVAVFNRTLAGVEEGVVERFMNGRGRERRFIGSKELVDFVKTLSVPRKIMMMVRAGDPVDELIDALIPLLDSGDILIDGGNSHFADTIRRTEYLESKGLFFVGAGVSGGEEGALRGPSIMLGGSPKAWQQIEPIFRAIAARAGEETVETAAAGGVAQGCIARCCNWVGEDGAGHFVKMVHNGIEYGEMQLICEAYGMMKDLLGMQAEEMQNVFRRWNEGDLNGYLVEITADILSFKDVDGLPLVDKILDVAGQKGTGKWAIAAALETGTPLTVISEAVNARSLSALKDLRVDASKALQESLCIMAGQRGDKCRSMEKGKDDEFLRDLEKALYASKIVSFAQGFALMLEGSRKYDWQLNCGDIALLWRGGCIVRSAFLEKIQQAFSLNPKLENLLLDPFFQEKVGKLQTAWRRVVSTAVMHGVWAPAMSAALCYYDGLRNGRLPINLLQAQRDYFGAHQYERVDRPSGMLFHTDWTGCRGETPSSGDKV